MDDNVVVFATTMKAFAITTLYFATCTKKYRPHMANFVISIGLLSLQCTPSMGLVCNYPWVFHDMIFNN
jgi:hypothetical protein